MRAIELYIKYEKSPPMVIRELGYPDRKMLLLYGTGYSRTRNRVCPMEKRYRRFPVLAGRTRGGSPPLPRHDEIFHEPSELGNPNRETSGHVVTNSS